MVLIHPEYALLILEINELRDEIAKSIVEKDTLLVYICKNIEIEYMLKMGALEYKLVIAENNYKKNLRKLEIIEEKIHKNLRVNLETINKKINTEFKKQSKLENDISKSIDFAIDMSSAQPIDYDILYEMNMDYFKLQKAFNPIFDMEISEEKLKNFKKIEKYYQKGNYKKIHKLAENYGTEEIFQDEISNLKMLKVKYLMSLKIIEKEIRKIKNSFPYNQKAILENEILCRRKKDKLNKEIINLMLENKKLERKINNKLKKM